MSILFADLPARAIASSIRVEGKATAKLDIGSVDSRRLFVPRTDDAVAATERKRVEDAIEKLKDDRALLQAAVQAAEAQKSLIGNLARLPSRPAPATGAAAPQPDWTQIFGIIGQHFAEAQKAILETQVKTRELDRQIKDLEGKLASLAPAQDERTGSRSSSMPRRRSRPTSPSATKSGRHRGCPSTTRASPPAPRRRPPSCSSCAAPASSSAAARAGTRWRSPSPPTGQVPAADRRSCGRRLRPEMRRGDPAIERTHAPGRESGD